MQSEGYLYASPDGSRAFFESTDALTGAARQAEEHGLPAGDAKQYMFDTETGALTYLPGVADAPLVELHYKGYGEHLLVGPRRSSSPPGTGRASSSTGRAA